MTRQKSEYHLKINFNRTSGNKEREKRKTERRRRRGERGKKKEEEIGSVRGGCYVLCRKREQERDKERKIQREKKTRREAKLQKENVLVRNTFFGRNIEIRLVQPGKLADMFRWCFMYRIVFRYKKFRQFRPERYEIEHFAST